MSKRKEPKRHLVTRLELEWVAFLLAHPQDIASHCTGG
jgi:hypothetical protein